MITSKLFFFFLVMFHLVLIVICYIVRNIDNFIK